MLFVRVGGAQTFTNPMLTSQDPFITYVNGVYYSTYTAYGCATNHICIKSATTLTGLNASPSHDVWSAPSAPASNQAEVWAPELHYINNNWYIYYAADDGTNDDHRLFVLQASNSAQPTGTYVEGTTGLAHGQLNESLGVWAIDPDVFHAADGNLYITFSCTNYPTASYSQRICIAPMSGPLTISGNSVAGFYGASGGGGIHNVGRFSGSATLTVTNSTLSGNSADHGGGIYNDAHIGEGAMLEIGNTILKTGSSGANIYNPEGTVTSLGYNLSNDNGGGFLTATGDQINTDPLLGPLQDNGGSTFTHALLTGSPAIDAGDPNFNPNSFNPPMVYDQRGTGFNRVVNGRIDIGAFEVQAVPSPYAGQVQQPINADGSSVFSVRRGVVPVKFTLTQGGVATCALPPATIALTRTAGGTTGAVDESVYSGSADNGSNFRIDSCQYVYNLSASALGVGTYRVDIVINGQVVGSGIFQLK